MRKLVLIGLFFLTAGCDDNLVWPARYPVFFTEEASFVQESSTVSAMFRARVAEHGTNYEVVRYGFVYAFFDEDPKLGESLSIEKDVNGEFAKGNFELYVEELGRSVGQCYYRAFIETDGGIFYGEVKVSDI